MSIKNHISVESTLLSLPCVVQHQNGRRVEFYGRSSDDETYSLIMIAGTDDEGVQRELMQGPFQRHDHVLSAVRLVVEQLIKLDYIPMVGVQLRWEMQAQRINNEHQSTRRRYTIDYNFKAEDVLFD